MVTIDSDSKPNGYKALVFGASGEQGEYATRGKWVEYSLTDDQ